MIEIERNSLVVPLGLAIIVERPALSKKKFIDPNINDQVQLQHQPHSIAKLYHHYIVKRLKILWSHHHYQTYRWALKSKKSPRECVRERSWHRTWTGLINPCGSVGFRLSFCVLVNTIICLHYLCLWGCKCVMRRCMKCMKSLRFS